MHSRLTFLTAASALSAATLLPYAAAAATGPIEAAADPDSPPSVTPTEALARLKEGNARFVAGKMTHPRQDAAHREAVAPKQRPFASIVACSDSRSAPETIFDQGIGDLFVTRLAGNVVDDAALGSLEFATLHFGTGLIVVLGHSHCGAVAATLDAIDAGKASAPGSIGAVVSLIQPSVKGIPKGPDRLNTAIDTNAKSVVEKIAGSSVFGPKIAAKTVQVVAAHYDITSGTVTWL